MRYMIIGAALIIAACSDSTRTAANNADGEVSLSPDESASATNVDDQLIANPNGTQTLRLEGNDTATFVGGELVDVNRAN